MKYIKFIFWFFVCLLYTGVIILMYLPFKVLRYYFGQKVYWYFKPFDNFYNYLLNKI